MEAIIGISEQTDFNKLLSCTVSSSTVRWALWVVYT